MWRFTLADARRMQDRDQDFESFYLGAIEKNPDDVQLYLDHGQYLEQRLGNCELELDESTHSRMLAAMQTSYETALSLEPGNPEANLALAQVYLLPGFNWEDGLGYHQKAWQLLPGSSFVAEQAVNYAIAGSRYDDAEQLITWLARPFHVWGEHFWITQLRQKLDAARQGRTIERCDA
ncbi:MAG: hypothetical protein RQ757_06875 [Pseudomonadales bacterium]|nr:hypothetical protein [Pseudomonadales bacterium]